MTKNEAIDLFWRMLYSKNVKKETSSVYDKNKPFNYQYIFPCYVTLIIEGEKVFTMQVQDDYITPKRTISWSNYHGFSGTLDITDAEYLKLKNETERMEQIDRHGAVYRGLEYPEILKLL